MEQKAVTVISSVFFIQQVEKNPAVEGSSAVFVPDFVLALFLKNADKK